MTTPSMNFFDIEQAMLSCMTSSNITAEDYIIGSFEGQADAEIVKIAYDSAMKEYRLFHLVEGFKTGREIRIEEVEPFLSQPCSKEEKLALARNLSLFKERVLHIYDENSKQFPEKRNMILASSIDSVKNAADRFAVTVNRIEAGFQQVKKLPSYKKYIELYFQEPKDQAADITDLKSAYFAIFRFIEEIGSADTFESLNGSALFKHLKLTQVQIQRAESKLTQIDGETLLEKRRRALLSLAADYAIRLDRGFTLLTPSDLRRMSFSLLRGSKESLEPSKQEISLALLFAEVSSEEIEVLADTLANHKPVKIPETAIRLAIELDFLLDSDSSGKGKILPQNLSRFSKAQQQILIHSEALIQTVAPLALIEYVSQSLAEGSMLLDPEGAKHFTRDSAKEVSKGRVDFEIPDQGTFTVTKQFGKDQVRGTFPKVVEDRKGNSEYFDKDPTVNDQNLKMCQMLETLSQGDNELLGYLQEAVSQTVLNDTHAQVMTNIIKTFGGSTMLGLIGQPEASVFLKAKENGEFAIAVEAIFTVTGDHEELEITQKEFPRHRFFYTIRHLETSTDGRNWEIVRSGDHPVDENEPLLLMRHLERKNTVSSIGTGDVST